MGDASKKSDLSSTNNITIITHKFLTLAHPRMSSFDFEGDFASPSSSSGTSDQNKGNNSKLMVGDDAGESFNYSITSPQFVESNVSGYSFVTTQSVFLVEGRNDGEQNGNEETLSLPLDFTQVSQVNKDCIAVYTVLFVLAVVGNLLVLSSVSRHDRLGKSRTPLLIINLCIADLIVSFFLMPTEIFWRLTIAWKGGDLLCKLLQFIRAFGLYLSSNVVICISVDRYFAIVYPLKLAGAVKRVKWMLVGAWIVSAVFAAPQMLVYHVASHPDYPQFRQCVTQAFLKTGPYNELIYNVSSVSALYFIPLLVIIYTYTMILWKIHKKSLEHRVANSQQETLGSENSVPPSPAQLNPQSAETIALHRTSSGKLSRTASKRTRLMLRSSANQTVTLSRARSRTLRLTLLILVTFIFCWTPYVVMTLWYMLDRGGASQVDGRLQEALFLMAVTNSVINPLIYGTVGRKQTCEKHLNSVLRSSSWYHRLLKAVCCCCLCGLCYKERAMNTDTIIMNGTNFESRRRTEGERNGNAHRARNLSPRGSHVVTLRTMRSNSGIVLRFVRSFGITSLRARDDEVVKTEYVGCGDTSHYIVPEAISSASHNLSSTQV